MHKQIRFLLFCFVCFISVLNGQTLNGKISGMTLVAPRDSFSNNPFERLQQINCQWVAVVPYAFTPSGEASVRFGNNHQWWGETPRGAEATIQLAHESGLKVMLKPQLWMHNSWVGALDFQLEDEWISWEKDYRKYIMSFAAIAEHNNVELLCIGTEFKIAVQKRTSFWIKLIEDVRKVYNGPITYCANWDDFEDVPLWPHLDIIGISAYFPLSENATPKRSELESKWKPIKKRIGKLSAKMNNKKVLFTEYGYLSVDGCAGKTWELEKQRMQLSINEEAQCNAFESLYASFCDEPYWLGGFLWKWYPNESYRRKDFRMRDYTPQNKKAEKVISEWFTEFNKS